MATAEPQHIETQALLPQDKAQTLATDEDRAKARQERAEAQFGTPTSLPIVHQHGAGDIQVVERDKPNGTVAAAEAKKAAKKK